MIVRNMPIKKTSIVLNISAKIMPSVLWNPHTAARIPVTVSMKNAMPKPAANATNKPAGVFKK
jgi:hypothetical protein